MAPRRRARSTAFNVNDGGANAFLQAPNTIRGQVVKCDFPVPPGTVDFNRVNVQLTSSGGTVALGKITRERRASRARGTTIGNLTRSASSSVLTPVAPHRQTRRAAST
jgi:hypothetical protein